MDLSKINDMYDNYMTDLTAREKGLKLLVKYNDTDIDKIIELLKEE